MLLLYVANCNPEVVCKWRRLLEAKKRLLEATCEYRDKFYGLVFPVRQRCGRMLSLLDEMISALQPRGLASLETPNPDELGFFPDPDSTLIDFNLSWERDIAPLLKSKDYIDYAESGHQILALLEQHQTDFERRLESTRSAKAKEHLKTKAQCLRSVLHASRVWMCEYDDSTGQLISLL